MSVRERVRHTVRVSKAPVATEMTLEAGLADD
jgi:hypothetical protein